MQRHWTFKLLAFVVAIVSGAALMVGSVGLLLGEPVGGYERYRENVNYDELSNFAWYAANQLAEQENFKAMDLSQENYNRFFGELSQEDFAYDFCYEIRSMEGGVLRSNLTNVEDYVWATTTNHYARTGNVVLMPQLSYYAPYGMDYLENIPADGEPTDPVPVEDEALATTAPMESTPESEPTEAAVPVAIPEVGEEVLNYNYYLVPADVQTSIEDVDPMDRGTLYYEWLDAAEAQGGTVYRIEYGPSREYEITIAYTEEQRDAFYEADMTDEVLYTALVKYQQLFGKLAIGGAVGLLLSVLWLCLVAGKGPKSEEIKPEGLNRIPLDVYLVLTVCGVVTALALGANWLQNVVYRSVNGYYDADGLELMLDAALYALLGGGCGLMIAMFAMACAAQMKQGDNLWAKNSLIGTCIRLFGLIGLETLKGCWKLVKAVFLGCGRFVLRCFRALGRLHGMLPLVWQWLLASAVLWLLMLLGFASYNGFVLVMAILLVVLVIVYGSYCFGKLRSSARNMAQGSLESKISDQLMLGCFKEFADDLNALGDTCVQAAKEQMKSERMKSELITNVSHDIKTPLTSIINYVDLLQKAKTEDERKEYLEVLDRQSQRLKKLIEDLMEMSKASSGNVAVEIAPTDVSEAVSQALGEYADALERCNLQVIPRMQEQPLMASCDGKLLWRVLSNCFGNVVKYALPGTRVYVDAVRAGAKVELSVKNISREPLNITAEELMERFVRGDASRNTEGNGLGLNIAKSLMEVQGGSLNLLVDGDLFKVVLTLKAAEEGE